MHPITYVVMGFGAFLAVVGILVFIKRGAEGTSSLKLFGLEFNLGGSALVIFVLGVVLFMLPFIRKDDFPLLMTATQDRRSVPKDLLNGRGEQERLLKGEFLGTVQAMKGERALPPIPLRISLHIAGAVVTGEYDNDSGDKGVLTGTIDGNSLDLRIVSFVMGGDCSMNGNLTDGASKFKATYTCPDGEHGRVNVVRK